MVVHADARGVEAVPHVQLRLDKTVDMVAFNRAFASIYQGEDQDPPQLLIDLEDVSFILVECLTALIAEVASRLRGGLETRIMLPLSRDVRGFLRDWHFPEAFLQGTGTRLRDIVDESNLARIREADLEFRRSSNGAATDSAERTRYVMYREYYTREGSQKVPFDAKRFFAFKHWQTAEHRLPDDPLRFRRAVLEESNRWLEEPELRAVMENALGEYYQYLPSDVVHESMSNSFRHGNASVVLGVSKDEFRRGHLTLVFWDNGSASYETILARIASGQSVTGSAFNVTKPLWYDVRAPAAGRRELRSSATVPDAGSPEWEVLLSTIFPGVTSDPTGADHFYHPELLKHAPPDAVLPGRGLSNLINGAVTVLRGSVAFRSGNFFMNVKSNNGSVQTAPDGEPVRYSVKITPMWKFFGNMVTIRLPLKD